MFQPNKREIFALVFSRLLESNVIFKSQLTLSTLPHWCYATENFISNELLFVQLPYTTFEWLMLKNKHAFFHCIAYTFLCIRLPIVTVIQPAKSKEGVKMRAKNSVDEGKKYHKKVVLTHRLDCVAKSVCACVCKQQWTVSIKVYVNIDTVQIFGEKIKIRLWMKFNWLTECGGLVYWLICGFLIWCYFNTAKSQKTISFHDRDKKMDMDPDFII